MKPEPKKSNIIRAGDVRYLGDSSRTEVCTVIITSSTIRDGQRKVTLKHADPSKAQGGLAFGYAKVAPWYIDPKKEYDITDLSDTPEEAYHKMLDLYTQQYKEQLYKLQTASFGMDQARDQLRLLEANTHLKYKIGDHVWAIVKYETGDLDVCRERIDKVKPDDHDKPYHYTDCWHKGWISTADVFDVRDDAVKECQKRLREHCERLCAKVVVPHAYDAEES